MKKVMKKIDILCWYNEKGTITPIKFRIHDKDKITEVKVDKVIKEYSSSFAGGDVQSYDCQGLVGGQMKRFTLRYELKSRHWFLDKI